VIYEFKNEHPHPLKCFSLIFFFIVFCCKVSIGWVLKAIPHHQFPGV
jgi:hypothetical protein